MKKILVCALVLGLVGCGVQKEPNQDDKPNQKETQQTIDKDDVFEISSSADVSYNLEDSPLLYEKADYVVLATIQSLDGVNNYSEVNQRYVYPYSYYTATIEKTYKGDIETTSSITLYKLGGTIPYEKYYEGLSQPEKDKVDSFGKEKPKYIEQRFMDDIELEVGKTYLFYMVDETSYFNKPNEYGVFGFQGGTREVNPVNLTASDSNEVQVFNNFTKQWENISDVIPNE